MCTLHLFYRIDPEAPVVFAANRDEILDRPWRPPEPLSGMPRVFGPRDLTAGGTWLGVNEGGVLVSLANHYGTLRRNSASLCSRGTLVLETLRHGSAREARRFAQWVAPACKEYTMLIADVDTAYVVDHAREGTQIYRLLPGCHVITNARFRDPEDPKAAHRRRIMEEFAENPERLRAPDLFPFLADHTLPAPDATPLCIHPRDASRFGTSSASVVRLASSGRISDFWTAEGPPCRSPFRDHTEAAGAHLDPRSSTPRA